MFNYFGHAKDHQIRLKTFQNVVRDLCKYRELRLTKQTLSYNSYCFIEVYVGTDYWNLPYQFCLYFTIVKYFSKKKKLKNLNKIARDFLNYFGHAAGH